MATLRRQQQGWTDRALSTVVQVEAGQGQGALRGWDMKGKTLAFHSGKLLKVDVDW